MLRISAVVVTVLLIAAGCSDGDSGPALTGATETPSATAAPDQPAPAEDDDPVASEPAELASDWCGFATEVDEQFDIGSVDLFDPTSVEGWIDDTSTALDRAVAIAPPEIADDLRTYLEGFMQFAELFGGADYDILQIDQSALDLLEQNQAFAEAGPNIARYNEDLCGIPATAAPVAPDEVEVDPGELEDLDDLGGIDDQIVAGFIAAGFTAAEAECLASRLSLEDLATADDPAELFGIFQDCGIGLDRLGEIG